MDQYYDSDLPSQHLLTKITEGNRFDQAGWNPFLETRIMRKEKYLIIFTGKYCEAFNNWKALPDINKNF